MTAAALDRLILGDVNPELILSAPRLEPAFGQAETLVDSADLVTGGSERSSPARPRDSAGARRSPASSATICSAAS
jgi:hypothetical protein